MRHRSDDPMISVSCGHRVPRVPVKDESEGAKGRNLYWCHGCSAYRMSGGKVTGLNGHAYLFALRDLVERNDRPIVVGDPCTPHGRRTVAALGAQIRSAA